MAPGVNVEQINANAWAISIRGFNSRYSNKVLVLIDGRTVYTPSFSGVFWEHLDLPLEDIERIEVIRGPGATVWGANAVNGVISIFTKSSKDTQGGLVSAGGGSHLNALGLAQYGGRAGKRGTYRIYGKYFSIGNAAMPDGSSAADHWTRASAGFRSDWTLSPQDSLTVQGDLFSNQAQQTRTNSFLGIPGDRIFTEGLDAAGGNLLLRWNHALAGGSHTSFQAYYDTYRRTDTGVPETLKTFDLDFQHRFSSGDRHDIVWGVGYRVSNSALAPGYAIGFSPPSKTDKLYSGFIQDEFRASDSLWFTIGCKLEHNPYTGVEVEPSVRLAWSPPLGRQTIWAAASRAIRQPSRVDTALRTEVQRIPLSPDVVQVVRLYGNPGIDAEELWDYEVGYRSELTRTLSLDVGTFVSVYHRLNTVEPQPLVVIAGSPIQFEIPLLFDNKGNAVTYGGEIALRWNASSRWRISQGYSYLHASLRRDASSRSSSDYPTLATGFPQNMFQLRSSLRLSPRTDFDQSLYYTARLPGGDIPGHARLDLRFARRVGEGTEVGIIGQNLLRPRTTEYGNSASVISSQSVRSVYVQITRRF
jgi:iron complex outermembrane receptor protein